MIENPQTKHECHLCHVSTYYKGTVAQLEENGPTVGRTSSIAEISATQEEP